MKQNNVFNCRIGRASLERLATYKKTNIRYSFIEKYGEERVLKDLIDATGNENCKLKVCYEDHVPMDLIRFEWYAGKTYKVHVPIMPLVIISLDK